MASLRSIALPAWALLAASGSAQSVLLRYRPPVGKTASYTMTMAMSMATPQKTGAPMSFSQTSPMSMRVVSRTADTTTIETHSGPAKFAAGSPMAKMPNTGKAVVMRLTLDQFGNPKAAAGGGLLAGIVGTMGQGGQGVAFPVKPVKVGDQWTMTVDLGKIMGSMGGGMKMNGKIPMVFRLTALRGNLATILMTANGGMSMKMSGKAMQVSMVIRTASVIDTTTGLAKSTSTTTDTITTLPGAGAMRQHMTMTLR